MRNTKISVCVATYNGAKYIRRQLESILMQLKDTDEVVVSDDGSTDGTLDIVEGLHDARVKIFRHEKDRSLAGKYLCSFYFASYNFENAIRHATGDVIYLADQDDIWRPDRVAKTLPCLEKYDFLMCNYAIIDGNDRLVMDKYLTRNPIKDNLLWNLWKIPFRGCCMAFNRAALMRALPFPRNCINHDIWTGMLLMHKGYTCKYIDEPLHLYRDHTTNVSSVVGKSPNSLFFKIKYRLRFLLQVITFR